MATLRTHSPWDLKDLAEYLATVRCGGAPFLDRGAWSLGSDNNVWLAPDTRALDGKTFHLTSRNYEGTVRYTAFLAFIASTIGTVEMDNRHQKEQLDKFIVNDKTLRQQCDVCGDLRAINLTHGAAIGGGHPDDVPCPGCALTECMVALQDRAFAGKVSAETIRCVQSKLRDTLSALTKPVWPSSPVDNSENEASSRHPDDIQFTVSTMIYTVDEKFDLLGFVKSLHPHWTASQVHLVGTDQKLEIYAYKNVWSRTVPVVEHTWPPVSTEEPK